MEYVVIKAWLPHSRAFVQLSSRVSTPSNPLPPLRMIPPHCLDRRGPRCFCFRRSKCPRLHEVRKALYKSNLALREPACLFRQLRRYDRTFFYSIPPPPHDKTSREPSDSAYQRTTFQVFSPLPTAPILPRPKSPHLPLFLLCPADCAFFSKCFSFLAYAKLFSSPPPERTRGNLLVAVAPILLIPRMIAKLFGHLYVPAFLYLSGLPQHVIFLFVKSAFASAIRTTFLLRLHSFQIQTVARIGFFLPLPPLRNSGFRGFLAHDIPY